MATYSNGQDSFQSDSQADTVIIPELPCLLVFFVFLQFFGLFSSAVHRFLFAIARTRFGGPSGGAILFVPWVLTAHDCQIL